MGELRIGETKFGLTDKALNQLQETLQNAFQHSPGGGLFLHFRAASRPDDGRQVSVWVSAAHDIVMRFENTPLRDAPEIVGVEVD